VSSFWGKAPIAVESLLPTKRVMQQRKVRCDLANTLTSSLGRFPAWSNRMNSTRAGRLSLKAFRSPLRSTEGEGGGGKQLTATSLRIPQRPQGNIEIPHFFAQGIDK